MPVGRGLKDIVEKQVPAKLKPIEVSRFTKVMGGVNLHGRTGALLSHISEINECIALKFDVLLGICICARAAAHPF